MSGATSFPSYSRQMASASSQARTIEQFVCGTPRRERRRQAHLLDTRFRSGLWHSRQMASASSQALGIVQFVCGTPQQEKWKLQDTSTSPTTSLTTRDGYVVVKVNS